MIIGLAIMFGVLAVSAEVKTALDIMGVGALLLSGFLLTLDGTREACRS